MKWEQFRRSDNIEDYQDPSKPVPKPEKEPVTITETIKLTNSELAKEAGKDDIKNG